MVDIVAGVGWGVVQTAEMLQAGRGRCAEGSLPRKGCWRSGQGRCREQNFRLHLRDSADRVLKWTKVLPVPSLLPYNPPCIANDASISTKALMIPHDSGIHVDILKKPVV